MERREILKAIGLAMGAGILEFGSFPKAAKGAENNVFLGVQFFTFVGRNGAQMGWQKYSMAMESVRKIGYDGIELAGFSGYKPEDIRKHANELGLAIPSVHCGFDQVFGFLPPPPLGPDDFTLAQDATYTPVRHRSDRAGHVRAGARCGCKICRHRRLREAEYKQPRPRQSLCGRDE